MVTTDLKFNFRDIFRIPRIALSGKKIFVFIQGNLFGFIVYWIFSYASLLMSGLSLPEALGKYGLYPCLFGKSADWYVWMMYYIGIFIWIATLFLCSTTVSRITLKQLKGNDFFSASDAWSYTKAHWHAVILSPIAILIIIIIFVTIAGFFALLSYIPVIGELFFSLLYLLYFFGAVFTLYTFFVLTVSLIYTPSIVGVYEEDTMGAVFHSYSIAFGQNWRIFFYHLILIPLTIIGIELFSWFSTNSIGFINYVFGFEIFNSPKLVNISNYAFNLVYPDWFLDAIFYFRDYIYSALYINYELPQLFSISTNALTNIDLSFSESLAGIILALSYFLIGLSVISYGFSIIAVAETIMFIIFKKISDDDNLLNRSDEEDIEEGEDSEILDVNDIEDQRGFDYNNQT
tara:strand:+ start:398 stop:1606 length:1209 start_codon:yes stop_codon:yes gene_type:complete